MYLCFVRVRDSQLLSLLTRLSVILSKFVLTVCDIGAALMSCFVCVIVALGMAADPFACVGHVGEKWSFTAAQHGHINQWLAALSERGRWFVFELRSDPHEPVVVRCFVYLLLFSLARASRSKAPSHWVED